MEGSGTRYFIIVFTQMIARSLFRDAVEGREGVSSKSQAVHLAFYCLERSLISQRCQNWRIGEQMCCGQCWFCRIIFSYMFPLNRTLHASFFLIFLSFLSLLSLLPFSCGYFVYITENLNVSLCVLLCKWMKSYQYCSPVLDGVVEEHCSVFGGAQS